MDAHPGQFRKNLVFISNMHTSLAGEKASGGKLVRWHLGPGVGAVPVCVLVSRRITNSKRLIYPTELALVRFVEPQAFAKFSVDHMFN